MKTKLAKTPPGPAPQHLLPQVPRIQKDSIGFLLDVCERYGDLVFLSMGSLPVYIVNHPDGVKHVLQDQHRRYSKDTIQYNSLATITGRGLLTSDGPLWLRQRRLAQPAFARPRMLALDKSIVPAARDMLRSWEAVAKAGQTLDVDAEMMRLTLEVVGKALFSINLRQEASMLTGAVLTALDHIVHRARNVVVAPAWLPTPRNLRFRRALEILDQAVYAMISDRRRSGQPGDDLLGMLLSARDEETGQAMEDRQVRDEIMTMLIAGHETVASALTWAWYLLATHPEEHERLRGEVLNAVGDREPNAGDLPALRHTANIFSEALRLYPPAWVITRKAVEADELCGYPIPAGALVIMSPYVIHRREDFWQNPSSFLPDRFLEEEEPKRHRFSYIPFGGGPRLCIGSQFAAVEAHLVMAIVAQKCRLELAEKAQVKVDALVTLRPQHGLPMHPRFY